MISHDMTRDVNHVIWWCNETLCLVETPVSQRPSWHRQSESLRMQETYRKRIEMTNMYFFLCEIWINIPSVSINHNGLTYFNPLIQYCFCVWITKWNIGIHIHVDQALDASEVRAKVRVATFLYSASVIRRLTSPQMFFFQNWPEFCVELFCASNAGHLWDTSLKRFSCNTNQISCCKWVAVQFAVDAHGFRHQGSHHP